MGQMENLDWKRRRSLSKPGTTCVCGRVSGQRSQLARMGGLSHTAPLRWGKPLDAEWKHGKTRGRNDHLSQIFECLQPVPTLGYDIGDAKVFLGESGDLACLPGEMKPEAWSRNFCGPSYPPELLGWLHSPQALAAGFAQCVRVGGRLCWLKETVQRACWWWHSPCTSGRRPTLAHLEDFTSGQPAH